MHESFPPGQNGLLKDNTHLGLWGWMLVFLYMLLEIEDVATSSNFKVLHHSLSTTLIQAQVQYPLLSPHGEASCSVSVKSDKNG